MCVFDVLQPLQIAAHTGMMALFCLVHIDCKQNSWNTSFYVLYCELLGHVENESKAITANRYDNSPTMHLRKWVSA